MKKLLDKIQLFLFYIRLSFANIPFILKFSFLKTKHLKILAISIVVLVISLVFSPLGFFSGENQAAAPVIIENPDQKTAAFSLDQIEARQYLLSEDEIKDKIIYFEGLLEKQPNHQDVLVNLSLLYYLDEQTEKAAESLNKAKSLNPNDEVFSIEPNLNF